MTNTIVIADSSELILNGLKVILQPEFDNDIILVSDYDSLQENLNLTVSYNTYINIYSIRKNKEWIPLLIVPKYT